MSVIVTMSSPNSVNSMSYHSTNYNALPALEVDEGLNKNVGNNANHNVKKRSRHFMEDNQENYNEKTIISISRPPKKKKKKRKHEKCMDQWDHKSIPSWVKLKDRTVTVRRVRAQGHASDIYGARQIASGVFRWRFRVDHVSSPYTDIGIVSNTHPNLYYFEIMTGRIYLCGSNQPSYARQCETGSVIEMILDLDRLKLSYVIDGNHYEKGYDVIPGEYRARVRLFKQGESVTMLS